jgi:hypothetical protein
MLERNLELYRDLSVALQGRITILKTAAGEDPGCKETLAAVKDHQRALQSVLDLEANLVKRSGRWSGGGPELDLAGARDEILARLALWTREG